MIIPIINKPTGTVIGQVQTNRCMTLDECIRYIGGEIITDEDDPRWSNDGDNVLIAGERYWYENLA